MIRSREGTAFCTRSGWRRQNLVASQAYPGDRVNGETNVGWSMESGVQTGAAEQEPQRTYTRDRGIDTGQEETGNQEVGTFRQTSASNAAERRGPRGGCLESCDRVIRANCCQRRHSTWQGWKLDPSKEESEASRQRVRSDRSLNWLRCVCRLLASTQR